jgi:peptidyl-tRNA hydrolase, PTH1 family
VKLITGLGNPGAKYQLTRHNIGFMVLDRLAEANHISVGQTGFEARFGKGMIDGQAVLLVKPQTFMNLSGISVRKFFEYYRINIDDVIVVHDDLDLPFGTIRFKAGGGHGGHKGLISIIDHLGMTDFNRVRLGIGKPVHKGMVDSYVLSSFSPDEMIEVPRLTAAAATALTDMLSLGIQTVMGKYHGKTINNFNEEV